MNDKIPLDSIRASVPPLYQLLSLKLESAGKAITLEPLHKIQMCPANHCKSIHFKFFGLDTYDVHTAFFQKTKIPDDVLFSLCVLKVSYKIVVIGEDGPSICATYQHTFKQNVHLDYEGFSSTTQLFKTFRALEHMPKLPHDWIYIQFIN